MAPQLGDRRRRQSYYLFQGWHRLLRVFVRPHLPALGGAQQQCVVVKTPTGLGPVRFADPRRLEALVQSEAVRKLITKAETAKREQWLKNRSAGTLTLTQGARFSDGSQTRVVRRGENDDFVCPFQDCEYSCSLPRTLQWHVTRIHDVRFFDVPKMQFRIYT